MRLSALAAAVLLAGAAPAAAQQPSPPPPVDVAAPADVASPEAVVAALYDVISGDAGQARDWDRFRSLFHPTARLMPSGADREGRGVVRSVTPDAYIARSEAFLLREGFHEREIARRSERFGRILHVWSTYETLHSLSDPAPFARGINSIQLFHDGARWWILSVYWQAETPEAPIPSDYLP
ncbi:hypothetical protein [Brevundimonas sp.]|uniref:hypothetical protein n=1 Tax=Brevundimonas sp. TaxID=1871086 RepID=UPI0035B27A3A